MVAPHWMLALLALAGKFTEGRLGESVIEKQFGYHPNFMKFPYDDIRLPGNIVPLEYYVHLHPNITDGQFGFTGSVKILLKVKKATDAIILHSKSLLHLYTAVQEKGSWRKIKVMYTLRHEKHELALIQLQRTLSAKGLYWLQIFFSGELAKQLRGFYKSSYKASNGETRYLATSHFEATGARLAFPCFDEPEMKAKFTIRMVREKIHTALSNMPVHKTYTRKDGLKEDHFQKSVRMSTYLVAFVVSDFAHKSTSTKRGTTVRVWAPPHLISQAEYAIQVTPKILEYYEKFFKVNFPLPKQDLIAIPDFEAGAMENWGLITYRLTALLYDEHVSSAANKQRVAVVIAHELAHQWFGNLVTMKWWNDLWLNEGFAAFIEYIGTNAVEPSWQMNDQFNIDNVQTSMQLDSKLNSHPISVEVTDPNDIGGLFDLISYNKGSSIIRMMRDFIGNERFNDGLAHYLKKYQFSNAVSDDLWQCLSEATKNTIDVKRIMDTWTLQMNYPVIDVAKDPEDDTKVILTQGRFVTDVIANRTIIGYTWEVPLTFYFQNDRREQREWLHANGESLRMPWPKAAGWLKMNVKQIGYYRVNYEEDNWKALVDQLNKDHTKLPEADRANLMDDAFALATGGRLSHAQALELTEYLVKERNYIPFVTGLATLGHIGGRLLHRPGHDDYQKYILKLVSPAAKELGWEDKGSHLRRFLRGMVLRSAAFYNQTDAVENAKTLYKEWMLAKKNIPLNLRSLVYTTGIQYGGEAEWKYMFQKYKTTIQPSEKRTFMYALAATTDKKTLQGFLDDSLNQKVVRSQDSGILINRIAANHIGTKMARDFAMKNWDEIYKRYRQGTDIGRIIKAVFSTGRTQEELDEATRFLDTHELGAGKLAGQRALAAIRNNMYWLHQNEANVVEWLKSKV